MRRHAIPLLRVGNKRSADVRVKIDLQPLEIHFKRVVLNLALENARLLCQSSLELN